MIKTVEVSTAQAPMDTQTMRASIEIEKTNTICGAADNTCVIVMGTSRIVKRQLKSNLSIDHVLKRLSKTPYNRAIRRIRTITQYIS